MYIESFQGETLSGVESTVFQKGEISRKESRKTGEKDKKVRRNPIGTTTPFHPLEHLRQQQPLPYSLERASEQTRVGCARTYRSMASNRSIYIYTCIYNPTYTCIYIRDYTRRLRVRNVACACAYVYVHVCTVVRACHVYIVGSIDSWCSVAW